MTLILSYFVVKFAAYVGWCYFGLGKVRPSEMQPWAFALRFGLFRLLLGLTFGLLIGVAVAVHGPNLSLGFAGDAILYLLTYLPVRWIEWTVMSFFVIPGSNSLSRWLVGLDRADRLWRLGGIGFRSLPTCQSSWGWQ
jgi:hypothetical protein